MLIEIKTPRLKCVRIQYFDLQYSDLQPALFFGWGGNTRLKTPYFGIRVHAE